LRQTRVNDEEEKHLETVCLLLALEFGDQRWIDRVGCQGTTIE
jgi:hypothetical protein